MSLFDEMVTAAELSKKNGVKSLGSQGERSEISLQRQRISWRAWKAARYSDLLVDRATVFCLLNIYAMGAAKLV